MTDALEVVRAERKAAKVAEALIPKEVDARLPPAIEAHLRRNPPKPGRDGLTGAPGRPGTDGRAGKDGTDGKPGLVWRGKWKRGRTYQADDAVEHKGSSYVATGEVDREPPKGWDLLAAKGEDGKDGVSRTMHIGGGGGGSSGSGLPAGGTTGQALIKQSGTDGDADWESPALNASRDMRRFLGHLQMGQAWDDTDNDGVLHGDSGLQLVLATGVVVVDIGEVLIAPTSDNDVRDRERYFASYQDQTDITALFSAPDATNDRIDVVLIRLLDLVTGAHEIQVSEGTPDPAPVATYPADDYVELFEILIPANETDQNNWIATDARSFVSLGSQTLQSVLENGNTTTHSIEGLPGGVGNGGSNLTLSGGDGDSGNDEGAFITLYGGDGSGNPGLITIVTQAVTFDERAGTADPSAGAGVAANLLSTYRRDNAGTGELWFKTGAADTAWTKIV